MIMAGASTMIVGTVRLFHSFHIFFHPYPSHDNTERTFACTGYFDEFNDEGSIAGRANRYGDREPAISISLYYNE